MAENVIAIILPEYHDKDNDITSDAWKSDALLDDVVMGECIKSLMEFVDFFSDEECKIIYDSKNILAFSYVMRMLPECYPSRESQLRIALRKITNWRSPVNRKSKDSTVYTMGYENLQDETRCELAAVKAMDSNNSCLIATHIQSYNGRVWSLLKNNITYNIDALPLNIQEVFNWISTHHKPVRSYNWNPKHGENGRNAHREHAGEEVSVLLCSRKHANELLTNAVGLQAWDYLYSYDSTYEKYMEYKAECKYANLPSNALDRKYHSYHLNSIDSIPKRILEKIRILRTLAV